MKRAFSICFLVITVFYTQIIAFSATNNTFLSIPFGISADTFMEALDGLGVDSELENSRVVMKAGETLNVFGQPVDYLIGSFDNKLSFLEIGFDFDTITNDDYINQFEYLSVELNKEHGKFDYREMSLNKKGYKFPYNKTEKVILFDELKAVTANADTYQLKLYWYNVTLTMSKDLGVYSHPVIRYQNRNYVHSTPKPTTTQQGRSRSRNPQYDEENQIYR